jgi:spermidine synthase
MQTEHQHLVLFEHKYFGKMLMLDGATQITKRDEFIYQEMMSTCRSSRTARPPGFDHRRRRLRHRRGVLKHKSVKRLTQVEIDASVVEFSKEHFPEFPSRSLPTSDSKASSTTA